MVCILNFALEESHVINLEIHGISKHLKGRMTQCQDEFRILSSRTQKLKVAKWCWKQRNEHNLMYIYHKQCENMQKIQ